MFEPIEIGFKGESFTVPANQVFGLIATIENYITFGDLQIALAGGGKNTALAQAYAAAVRYAGGKATHDEVYCMMFDKDSPQNVKLVLSSIMSMMIPPDAIKKAEEEQKEDDAEEGEKKPEA